MPASRAPSASSIYTRPRASTSTASWSRSPRPGRASRRQKSSNSAASIPTSHCCSRSPRPWPAVRPGCNSSRPSSAANDPGVRSVTQIYNHYKHCGIATEVMGASFRNLGQITALAGCDLLTIAPELLARLVASAAPLQPALDAEAAKGMALPAVNYDEAGWRYALNEDAMATEKLAE